MGDADLGCPIHIHLVMLGVVVAYSHPTSITSGSPPLTHLLVRDMRWQKKEAYGYDSVRKAGWWAAV